jgi:uncharacterized protein (TIGR02145 family)
MKNIQLLPIILVFLAFQVKAQTVSDVDSNTYNIVTIGTQIWMKENLKTTKYNDGTAIPNIKGATEWYNTNSGYSWYDNDAATYKNTYGALYNWYTVHPGKLCPTGWHVPDTAEWTTLINYLEGEAVAGGKLKESGTTHWENPNTADNSSYFTALPGGWHDHADPLFRGIGINGKWWSSMESSDLSAYYINLYSNDIGIYLGSDFVKTDALSIRCLKDSNSSSINNLDNHMDFFFYPNPANDRLYLKNIKSSDAQIMIFDLHGKQVISRQISSNPIDISSLSKGVYTVKIVDSGNNVISKLIK